MLKRLKVSNLTEEDTRKFMIELGKQAYLKEPEIKIPLRKVEDKRIKVFLDDTRLPSKDFTHLFLTYECLIDFLGKTKAEEISYISLDHDLGTTKTGYDVCKWFVENDYWIDHINIHTANPVGERNMFQLLNRYAPNHIRITRNKFKKED